MAVHPECEGFGIGKALQEARLIAMNKRGVKTVISHSDRDETILWYKKHYGYKEIGEIRKEKFFGVTDASLSTVLELDLEHYIANYKTVEQKNNAFLQKNFPHPMAPYPPLIINVALTGIVPHKALTPHVPITIDEIILDAIKVHDAGASIVHLHARDEDGVPTSNPRFFESIITALRKERPQLICCVSTSGRGGQSFEQRAEVLHLSGMAKPDMASLALGSMNFLSGPNITTFETTQRLAFLMKEKGITPELEVFDSGMVNIANYLEQYDIISNKKYFNILLGNINTAPGTLTELSHLSSSLPENSIWAATGLGVFQLPVNTMAIAAGGHVRVGLEDNIYNDTQRSQLSTNEMLVQRVCRIANEQLDSTEIGLYTTWQYLPNIA